MGTYLNYDGLSLYDSKLKNYIDLQKDTYSVVSTTPENGFVATYRLTKNGENIGDSINIPKDWLLTNVELKTCSVINIPENGFAVGDKYFDFSFNTKDSTATITHIYLNVNDLIDTYIDGDGIDITDKVISIKLYLNGGLTFKGESSDELAIDFESDNINFENY